ncbi:MAG: tetratricopeptide repeat protein [Flavobacteriia bacterium]|nr:tetratricopeptide repeat protein [Flavobacteriia bacterium]
MKLTYKTGLFAIAIALASCEAVDPFETVNPNIGEDDVVGVANSSVSWKAGLDRQMAITFNQIGVLSEIASDNYDNINTFYNQFVDDFNIQWQDNDINVAHRGIGRLREKALFGINEVGPNDPAGFSDATKAEYYFYLGVAYLYAGEYFNQLPQEDKGALVDRTGNLNSAVTAFGNALAADPNHVGAMLGRARAYYHLGDATNAVTDANAALAADPDYVRYIEFDPVNSSGNNNGFDYTKNNMQLALQERGGFDDLQPLPTLDFLDPKVYSISGSQDSPIPLMKAEEAHLIIAESQIASSNLPGAATTLNDLLTLVASRPSNTFDDSTEDRHERDPGSRPDTTVAVVNGRSGLVLNRKAGPVTVPAVSGTSADAAEIAAAVTGGEDAMLTLLYRMRQEIFIAEGRRFKDMGLSYVISEVEALQNENIGAGHPSTISNLPAFLTAIAGEADEIDYDPATFVCTVTHDVNAIIVANKTSDAVCPFH